MNLANLPKITLESFTSISEKDAKKSTVAMTLKKAIENYNKAFSEIDKKADPIILLETTINALDDFKGEINTCLKRYEGKDRNLIKGKIYSNRIDDLKKALKNIKAIQKRLQMIAAAEKSKNKSKKDNDDIDNSITDKNKPSVQVHIKNIKENMNALIKLLENGSTLKDSVEKDRDTYNEYLTTISDGTSSSMEEMGNDIKALKALIPNDLKFMSK